MEYYDCAEYQKLQISTNPLVSEVQQDDFTNQMSLNFDYDFSGKSEFYPFIKPNLPDEFGTCCIVGSSGSGKTTLLKEFLKDNKYKYFGKKFDNNKAVISNFDSFEDGSKKLSAVGLNSLPVWCKPRNVLSTGEGFRADLALNLDNYTVFDEFTSTIDRTVAKSTCTSLNRYIKDTNMHNVIFVSCHKDFINYLCPDFVIDTDSKIVYDCRGESELKKDKSYVSMNPLIKMRGTYLGSITI